MKGQRCAVIIPVFNHGLTVAAVVREALQLGLPVLVVDDGSTDATAAELKPFADLHLLRHEVNLGKGAALLTGFAEAAKLADWAITMDADGQHRPEDAVPLMAALPGSGPVLVVGCRQGMSGANVPWTSRFGRKFSNFWVWVAGGPRLQDSQSGFRIYPLPEVLGLGVKARRFQFEVEVLVKARRQALPVIELPVRVIYQERSQRISHFHPFLDFFRNFATFSRLITQRVFRGLFGQ